MRVEHGKNARARLVLPMFALLFAAGFAQADGTTNPRGMIDIEKFTNGVDADDPLAGDAPQIAPGDPVTWTYVVTNVGELPLSNISVMDNQGVMVTCPQTTLDVGESMECMATGVADDLNNTKFTTVLGVCDGEPDRLLYQNKGRAQAKDSNDNNVIDIDPSHYCNPEVPTGMIDIDIRKQEEGPDTRTFDSGSDVDFEIVVTNAGDQDLDNVMVTDMLAPECDRDIGSLAAGASVSYICTVPNVTVGFENEACVEGQRNGVMVDDCDPSTVEIPPPPGGGQGCTPGFWKQSQHFDSWTAPYTPDTPFSDVFEDAFPGMTLLDAASNGGGGLDALGRHTVAALLNAASPDVSYDQSVSDVVGGFNDVFPGSKKEYEGLKDVLNDLNEQGCPLH